MAKANLTLPSGATVAIEGTTEEVAGLVNLLSMGGPQRASPPEKPQRKAKVKGATTGIKNKRTGLQTLLERLVEEDFFNSKRGIADVRAKLEEGGHIYPMERLSTPLLRLVRGRSLRRFKEGGAWVYVS
jgi:hypothetical protein